VLDTWFSSALWPFATLGWPDSDAPEFRAFFPTDTMVTARDIIFLWVARMIMTSLEFTGEAPFSDVYVHSIIQAPDGRRMSKSLGTGIDPLEEMERHGADALRFGLLAMSSAQDVRFSEARVQQGRDLANKMWNASRLVLMEARDDVEPGPRTNRVEDRWIASRLQRAVRSVSESIEASTFRMPPSISTTSSGPSSATGISKSSSRGSTTATRTLRRPPLDARAGAGPRTSDDALRHRGDLLVSAGAGRRGAGRPSVSRAG
jgi:valyl-tRNA synthetase